MGDNRHQTGPSSRNISCGRDQNVNYGGDQVIGGETYNVSGDYVRHCNASGPNPHKTLWDKVAGVGASHTAEQQYERGECLEDTRVELRKIIHEWAQARGEGSPLFWLTGAAGVGKTAIAMSVAKELEKEGALVSSFFFFRSDPKRNNPQALWLSVAHGLVSTMPVMRRLIERRISEDPKILEARLEDQFRALVLNPFLDPVLNPSWRRCLLDFFLQALCLVLSSVMLVDAVWGLLTALLLAESVQAPGIVIIDGLDECSDEATQLRILSIIRDAVQHAPHFPLRFLICSRPEAWIKEAFDAERFHRLLKVVVVDKAFEDIITYCHHQFQEIVDNPKYKHVRFPNPWPSQEDFGTLVNRSSSQFVYVKTVFSFITLGGSHPMNKLRIILDRSPANHSAASPYPELDALYRTILEASSNCAEVHAILVAILVLSSNTTHDYVLFGPSYLTPTPTHIELLLGLPEGQVAIALRGMHSVLHIGEWSEEIHIHHNSFRDYLIDQSRSRSFYIDLDAQKHVIAQQWLEKLTPRNIQAYSLDQLYSNETVSFFVLWKFCVSFPKPTRNLLEHLQHVSLSSIILSTFVYNRNLLSQSVFLRRPLRAFQSSGVLYWFQCLEECRSWILKYNRENVEDITKYSFNNTAEDIPQVNSDCNTDREQDRDNLVKDLLAKFSEAPLCLHLECAPGVSLDDSIVYWTIQITSGGKWETPFGSSSTGRNNVSGVRLTDCSCEGNQSSDLNHLAYQEACMGLLKAFISELDNLPHINTSYKETADSLGIFLNVVHSSLLRQCRPDAELLSLCSDFFHSVQRSPAFHSENPYYCQDDVFPDQGKTKLLNWIGTAFPPELAHKVEGLREQVLALPWNKWTWEAKEGQDKLDRERRAQTEMGRKQLI
ncbi:hypothetical protein PM082_023175 [Marasmius tenuissimus]|nr:hypothetical protein PM082_023175 [Marasmius tenuissimus]